MSPGPERVAIRRVPGEVDAAPHLVNAADIRHVADAHALRQRREQRYDRDPDAGEHDDHLQHIRPDDGRDAPHDRIGHGDQPHDENRHALVPTHDDGKDDGRGVEDDPRRESARHEKEETGQRPGSGVEAAFEVLVGGEDLRAIEEGDEYDAENDHGDRLAQIELDELHAVVEGLSGRADIRDRTRLRRHHRETDGAPAKPAVGEKETFDAAVLSALPPGEGDDGAEIDGKDEPVESAHGSLKSSRRVAR